MKYWPKMQVEPALLGPGLLCSYSQPAYYKMETNHRIRPPWIWVFICFNFHVTSFNSIKSKIMQQRRIWSHLPTYLIPTAQEDPGCALDCTYNFRLKAPSSFTPQNHPSSTCLSPSAAFPIRKNTTWISAAFQTMQFFNKFHSSISIA